MALQKVKPFVDMHQHCLWGLDDGAQDSDRTLDILKAASAEGIHTIAATPHIHPGIHPFDADVYLKRIRHAQTLCNSFGLDIQLIGGAEIRYNHMALNMLRDGRIPTLGNSRYVLIEFWHDVHWHEVKAAVDQLFRGGFIPVIAHIERYRCFYANIRSAIAMQEDADVLYQVNTHTVIEPRNILQKLFLNKMLENRAIAMIATDAHNTTTRPPRMKQAYEIISGQYGKEYADALVSFDIKCDRSLAL